MPGDACSLPANVSVSDCRLNITPEVYIQVRTRNGSSWLTSSKLAPQRARMNPQPTLKMLCRISTGTMNSQYGVTGSRAMTTMMNSTAKDSTSCCSSIST